MSIFWGLENFVAPDSGAAVTIGTFDGLHLGHQALLGRLKDLGSQHQLPTVAVTFDRHPMETVAPQNVPPLLLTARNRAERIAWSGVNRVLVLRFDEELANMEAEDFVREILLERVRARHIVVGQNFRFGRRRAGGPSLLASMGPELGFSVDVLPPQVVDDQPVSSTSVRQCLLAGDVVRAARMLGIFYYVRGEVVHGDARGRKIGYPTANVVTPPNLLLPANGVYAVNIHLDDITMRGAANIGIRPTIGGSGRHLEVHIVGYNGDLYGQILKVRFLARLRDERKFASLDDLVRQIHRDVQDALAVPDCVDSIRAATASI